MDPNDNPNLADVDDLLVSSDEEVERGVAQIEFDLFRARAFRDWCETRLRRLRAERSRVSSGLHVDMARLVSAQILEYPAGYIEILNRVCLLRRGRLERLHARLERTIGWLASTEVKVFNLFLELNEHRSRAS